MIKTWLVTGDTHGKVAERLATIESNPQETAVIILGDAGLNFYLNKTDRNEKRKVQQTGFTIYCVRGNHEERPGRVSTMECNWDETVHGMIYQEPEFPNIRYFVDGCEYQIANHSALVIGGAYSVDKYYRLSRYHNGQSHFLGWFEQEQLSEGEMLTTMCNVCGRSFDFVLTHTCPFDWMPTDLFLPHSTNLLLIRQWRIGCSRYGLISIIKYGSLVIIMMTGQCGLAWKCTTNTSKIWSISGIDGNKILVLNGG